MDKKFERYCPKCNKLLLYLTEKARDKKEKNRQLCLSCSMQGVSKPHHKRYKDKQFERHCPQCNKILLYTSICLRDHAEKKQKLCVSCSVKNTLKNVDRTGKNNSFYGKHHSEKTKKILSTIDRSYTQTDEFKNASKKCGDENGMYGKSLYDVWLIKYDKQEADKRQKALNLKRSENAIGKKNGMYGKPSPIFSGNGWSGWYKKWFFRSLRELSYVINVLEVKKLVWQGAEKIHIPYVDYKGHDRTYTPDFLVENSILVEIKPKRLKKLWNNKLKRASAIKYCKEHNLTYKMFDVKRNRLTMNEFIDLFQQKIIILTDKCKRAMDKRIQYAN
ncbi:MAG: NUMOD3 domain-containing DNA-binding protein [Nitrosarchaeum sp.]|nr:NUMOD3 domain-containing DNA-binding protein [Nitrosarchaeum sp.]